MQHKIYDRHDLVRSDVKQVCPLQKCTLLASTLDLFVSAILVLLDFLLKLMIILVRLQVICSVCDTEQPVFPLNLSRRQFFPTFCILIVFVLTLSRLHMFVSIVASTWESIFAKYANSTMMM